ncbi:hypothetical protein [Hyphomicrobium sp. CS1BSMeth3]|uniref:hypothetical protein n=1 Tax=Hyphomicrobium sp. CS1BSMeth3 TaxID=1892844 RepID=UPI0009301FDE|nr:hypothetical protein [Hyphomicrobium sp. CS1BSMeth3]
MSVDAETAPKRASVYYSADALVRAREGLAAVPGKQEVLQARFLMHPFKVQRAREFAHHGFVRRTATLARSVANVFALIPPERIEPLDDHDVRHDAEINIQAAVFSAFAAVDNLAWIWVIEKDVLQPNGEKIRPEWVGLRPKNWVVRDTLPDKLREFVAGFDEWFAGIDNYRHALAHRIPLYIPPYCIDPKNAARHEELDLLQVQAATKGKFEEMDRLRAEQEAMRFFRPWIQHSFSEGASPLGFHPQLLANFNTIEALGNAVLDELRAE